MNKEKESENSREEILINNSKLVEDKALEYLSNRNFIKEKNEIDIKVIDRYREQIELTKKDSESKDTDRFYLYVVQWEYINPDLQDEDMLTELEFLVEEDENGNIVNINTLEDLIGRYELEKVRESIEKVKEHNIENENETEEQQEEKFKKDNLKELEKKKEEKEEEQDTEKKEGTGEKTENKKRKPSYVIETINPDEAKIDYWQNIKQAFNLPSEVATLAFAYPVSSEDKVDHANITVYMLDKDGNIIDGLDVDNYFEFDSSTGNNPTQDKTQRLENDENKGKVQLDDQYTMIRLKAKNGSNTYISVEEKNGMGDDNDINAGRKAVGSTENVEMQLETDRVKVWDSERELLMKSNAGIYHINDMIDEAKAKEDHGQQEYTSLENADGYSHTKVPCSKHIYVIIECLIKLKENDYIRDNYSDREIVNRLIDVIDKNPNITKDELITKLEGDIMGDSEGEYEQNNGTKEKDDEGYEDGPWRNSMRLR